MSQRDPGLLARFQAAVVDEESGYRQFVRAAGVATAGLVLAYALLTVGVVDLSPAVVSTFEIAAGVAVALFVLLGLVQFVVIARAYEHGTEAVAETAAQLERAAEEVETAAEEVDETAETVEEAATEVETAAKDVDQATERAEDASASVDEATEKVGEATEKADDARDRTEAARDAADEAKETVEREREGLPEGAKANGAEDDEGADDEGPNGD